MSRAVTLVIYGVFTKLKDVLTTGFRNAYTNVKNKVMIRSSTDKDNSEDNKTPEVRYDRNPKGDAVQID